MKLILSECQLAIKNMPDNSVDAIVTDPPYGLSFMGKKWDYEVPSIEIWKECLRVLKPGGHLLSFGGTRTYHRAVVNIEDAGFEIRDQIQWLYGSGFPKSHNLKDDWQGFGTALKPANEPICVARKPLEKGLTIAENVLKYRTGAINIDGSRIVGVANDNAGRWPANIILDEAAAEILDEQSGILKSGSLAPGHIRGNGTGNSLTGGGGVIQKQYGNDSGGASRFFYVAKASKRERGEGNVHPTVKPIKLMEYLIKLVTPAQGTILDPFMGSGSTGVAAKNLGFEFIGIEMNDEYFEIAKNRIGVK